MRSHSYLNTCKKIIDTYDGAIPFASWLKQFFKAEKKYGGSDRKQIAHACYCYFRLGKAFTHLEIEEKILAGLFLCSAQPVFILKELKPDWNEQVQLPLEEKINMLDAEAEIPKLFPFKEALSEQIPQPLFQYSLLEQPDLFIRIRPGKKALVLKKLQAASIAYQEEGEFGLRLLSQTKMEDVLLIDEEVVVQDLNSQKTLDGLHLPVTKGLTAWDCCAASGGKSILLHDLFPGVQITVSDVRETIIANLRKRFSRAGIQAYQSFVADLSSGGQVSKRKFDIVICDAPCSGSGTWARTPEQLLFFGEEQINQYTSLQKTIALQAAKYVKEGGWFIYITCSVFTAENESMVQMILEHTGLSLTEASYLPGYKKKADSLFTAFFRKN
ncbi:MAG: Fmu (Sun) domain-containing protein [Flavisolibacter sp.]